jgi:hypothetical protein
LYAPLEPFGFWAFGKSTFGLLRTWVGSWR